MTGALCAAGPAENRAGVATRVGASVATALGQPPEATETRPAATVLADTVSIPGGGFSDTAVDDGVAVDAIVLNDAGKYCRPTVAAPATPAAASSTSVVTTSARGRRGLLRRT